MKSKLKNKEVQITTDSEILPGQPIADQPMKDEQATDLHWLVLECLNEMLFSNEPAKTNT